MKNIISKQEKLFDTTPYRKGMFMCSFSGGRSSALMTIELAKIYGPDEMVICFSNTGKEVEGTLQFVKQVDEKIGGRVVWLEFDAAQNYRIVNFKTASRSGEPFNEMMRPKKYLPNVMRRFCTQELKIRPIKHYMLSLGHQHWINSIGIRYDEPQRLGKAKDVERRDRWENYYPLADWKITKQDVLDYWKSMPFDLTIREDQGNCDLCFLKAQPKRARLILENPAIADWWIDEEKKRDGATFRKGISVEQFRDKVLANPGAWIDQEQPDIPCICNTD